MLSIPALAATNQTDRLSALLDGLVGRRPDDQSGTVPDALQMAGEELRAHGHPEAGAAVNARIDAILARPEHVWFEEGAEEATRAIRRSMRERYGAGAGGAE